MQKIYKDKGIVILKLISSGWIAVIFCLALLFSGNVIGIIAGLLCFLPILYVAYVPLCKPALIIEDKTLHVNNLFGKTHKVADVGNYKLVISKGNAGYFAFRLDGQNDIMIDNYWFKKGQLEDLLKTLKPLGFKEIIE